MCQRCVSTVCPAAFQIYLGKEKKNKFWFWTSVIQVTGICTSNLEILLWDFWLAPFSVCSYVFLVRLNVQRKLENNFVCLFMVKYAPLCGICFCIYAPFTEHILILTRTGKVFCVCLWSFTPPLLNNSWNYHELENYFAVWQLKETNKHIILPNRVMPNPVIRDSRIGPIWN